MSLFTFWISLPFIQNLSFIKIPQLPPNWFWLVLVPGKAKSEENHHAPIFINIFLSSTANYPSHVLIDYQKIFSIFRHPLFLLKGKSYFFDGSLKFIFRCRTNYQKKYEINFPIFMNGRPFFQCDVSRKKKLIQREKQCRSW